jgi:hypothetical protein
MRREGNREEGKRKENAQRRFDRQLRQNGRIRHAIYRPLEQPRRERDAVGDREGEEEEHVGEEGRSVAGAEAGKVLGGEGEDDTEGQHVEKDADGL